MFFISSDEDTFEENLSGIAYSNNSVFVGAAGLDEYRKNNYADGSLAEKLIGGRFSAVLKNKSR